MGDLALISALAFALNLIVNFQDVSVDGLAADIVPEDERGRTAGVMFGGQAIGIAVTSAVTGWLLIHYGMRGAALACMVYVVAVLVLAALCRERAGERLLPWTHGEASSAAAAVHVGAWRPLFERTYRAMARGECLRLWFASFAFGGAYGMSLSVLPSLATQQAGFSAAEYGALTGTVNLAVGIACFLLFGYIADRVGPLRMYRTSLVVFLVACVAMLLAQPLWAGGLPVTLMVIAVLTLRMLLNVPYNAMALGLSNPAVAATQVTLFNCGLEPWGQRGRAPARTAGPAGRAGRHLRVHGGVHGCFAGAGPGHPRPGAHLRGSACGSVEPQSAVTRTFERGAGTSARISGPRCCTSGSPPGSPRRRRPSTGRGTSPGCPQGARRSCGVTPIRVIHASTFTRQSHAGFPAVVTG